MPGHSEEVEIIDLPEVWSHDGEGYPRLEDLRPDPDRRMEASGSAAGPPAGGSKVGKGEVGEGRGGEGKGEGAPVPLFGLREEFGVHLEELRRRLAASLLAFAPFFVLGLCLYRELWAVVILPLERAAPHLLRFQALNPSDGLIMAMRIAFAFALFLSLPVWLSQLWRFVAPGLTAGEIRGLYLSLGAGGVLFVVGAAAAYFVGVPLALAYLLPFNQTLEGWENAFTGAGYVDFVIACCGGFGLAFELPLLMLALGWAGIVTPESLRSSWRGAVLGIVVLAAFLTPPDPFTQLILAVPMLALFWLGCRLVNLSAGKKGDGKPGRTDVMRT